MHHVKLIKSKIVDNLTHGKPALADLADPSGNFNSSNVASALGSLRKRGVIERTGEGQYGLIKLQHPK